MARHAFGGDIAAYVITAGTNGVATLAGGVTITFWTAQTGGTQITDLALDSTGATPVDHVVSSVDGVGTAVGSIPMFYGPNNVSSMWAAIGGMPRFLMSAIDIGDRVAALEAGAGSGGVPTTRQIIAGTGLSGGGDLTANRTLAVTYGTTAGTAAQGNDTRITGAIQVAIIDGRGDLIAGSGPDAAIRLAAGTDGQILYLDSTTPSGLKWAAPPSGTGISPTIVDLKGDLIVGSTADTVIRLPAGPDGQMLYADSSTPSGLKWAAAPSGGGGVPTTRQIIAGTGLSGGGDLTADRTLTVVYGTTAGTAAQGNDTRITGAVPNTRTVTAGTGLTGGGDLTANRTLAVSPNTTVQQVEVSKNGTLVGTRKRFNIIEGANVTATVTDNAGSDRVDITLAAAAGGGGSTVGFAGGLFVCASNASTADKAKADYLCDGTADNVEIQNAITAAKTAGHGVVRLSSGTFNLAAMLLLEGADNVDTDVEITLAGAGPTRTALVAASGLTAGIQLAKVVRPNLSGFQVQVGGATHGIASVATVNNTGASPTPGETAGFRSFWMGTFRNLQVVGPWDGTHSGWALHLGSPFRSVFENIEIGGTGNGVRLFSESDQFNPGDCTFTRMFIDISGNSKTAISIDSPILANQGQMNQMNFSMVEAIASGTGCTGIFIGGTGGTPGPSNHNRFWGTNLEQFDKIIDCQNGTANVFELNYVCPRGDDATPISGLTAFTFGANAWFNMIRHVAELQIFASTVLVNDGNTIHTDQPNIVERVKLLVDAGTVTATRNSANTTVIRDIVTEGAGTATAVRRSPNAILPNAVITLTDAATIATDASLGNHFRVTLAGNRTLGNPTNPVDGQKIMWELIQDATGSRTITLGSAFALGTDISAVTLTTTASKRDFLGAVWNAALSKWLVVAFVKGY